MERGDNAAALHGLRETIDEFLGSPEPTPDLHQLLVGRLPGGWAVVAANGECYALRASQSEAERARDDADDHLYQAAACGHPRANGWVEDRLPIVIRQVTRAERDALLEEGTPVLDREP